VVQTIRKFSHKRYRSKEEVVIDRTVIFYFGYLPFQRVQDLFYDTMLGFPGFT
jgi:hypothetical protein